MELMVNEIVKVPKNIDVEEYLDYMGEEFSEYLKDNKKIKFSEAYEKLKEIFYDYDMPLNLIDFTRNFNDTKKMETMEFTIGHTYFCYTFISLEDIQLLEEIPDNMPGKWCIKNS